MRARGLLTLALMAGLIACTKEAPGLGGGGSGGIGNNANALISGRVFDADTNQPVTGATVKSPSGATTTTDANGEFTIEADPGKTVLTVEEADHAKGVKEVDAYQDAESYVELFAKGVSKDTSLDGVTGGTVKVGEMTVLVPADSVENEDGTKYNGQITIEVATVRPEKSNELSAFPGKFDGTTVDDQAGSVATQAAASIRLLNTLGQPLRMTGTARVEIFMPIRSALSQRNTRLWKLREASADWEEVGFQAVRDVDPITNEPALRSAVAALTWWNAGNPFIKSRVRGCLQLPGQGGSEPMAGTGGSLPISGSGGADGAAGGSMSSGGVSGGGAGTGGASDEPGLDAGVPRMQSPLIGDNPLAGIQVVATGIGYGYFAEKYTDDDGCFELEVKALGPVAIYAQTRLKRSAPRRVIALGPGMVRDLGMIQLGERDSECPGVMVDCGEGCVDILTSNDHCGACGDVCAGEPSSEYPTIVPVHCSYGLCGCDDNQDDSCISGGCANVETDSENCGGCGIVCGVDQECVDSVCVDIACPSGQVICHGACVPADPGCGVASDCSDWDASACPTLSAASVSNGYDTCCNAGTCGIATTDSSAHMFVNSCASTEYNRPEVPGCPSGLIESLGLYGVACCRSNNLCGMVLEGADDLGCVLLSDLAREYPDPVPCGGATGGDGGTMVMPDAGGSFGDAGVPPLDAGQ